MREWQVGDPIGDGNDIGVPDTKYMGYLRNNDENNQPKSSSSKDIELSKQYYGQAMKLKDERKVYDALSFINAAIRYNPDDSRYWNQKGIILWIIMMNNDVSVGLEAYNCFNEALTIKPDEEAYQTNKKNFLPEWGLKLFSIGDNNQAMVRVNEALSLIDDKSNPSYIKALTTKIGICLSREDYTNALKYCDEALEILPNDDILLDFKQKALEGKEVDDLIW